MRRRNSYIDILKFIFAVIVVLRHAELAICGHLAVEFFFMVSGYFLAQKANSYNSSIRIFDEVTVYTKKRYFSFLPYTFVAAILSLCCNFFFNKWSVKTLILNIIYSIPDIMLLQMEGIPLYAATGVSLYLSALIITIVVFYPILLKKEISPFVFGLISVSLYGFVLTNYGSLENPGKWLGLCYIGTLRAFAGVAAGTFLYFICEHLKKKQFTIRINIGITLICNIILFFCISGMIKIKTASISDIYIVGGLFISLISIFSEKNYLNTFFNHFNLSFFAEASFAIYLGHFYVVTNIINCDWSLIKMVVVSTVLIILCSSVIHFGGLFIKKIFVKILKAKGDN